MIQQLRQDRTHPALDALADGADNGAARENLAQCDRLKLRHHTIDCTRMRGLRGEQRKPCGVTLDARNISYNYKRPSHLVERQRNIRLGGGDEVHLDVVGGKNFECLLSEQKRGYGNIHRI